MKLPESDLLRLPVLAGIALVAVIISWKLFDSVVFSVSLAVVLYPLHASCSRYMHRFFSAALVTVLVVIVLSSAVMTSAAVISSGSSVIRDDLAAIRAWLQDPATDPVILGLPFDRQPVAGWFAWAETLLVNSWNTVISDPALIAIKILAFFLLFCLLLLYGTAIHDRILAIVPEDLRGQVLKMGGITIDTLYAIFIVHLGISVLTFFIAIPVFILLGYGNILLYSFLCAFCELIPVLGSSVFFIFVGLYALSIGDIFGVVIVLFFGYFCVAALPEIYIRPVLMGRRVKIHPVVMFIGFCGGLIVLGLPGFVLGPVLLVLLVTQYRILVNGRRGRREGESRPSPPQNP